MSLALKYDFVNDVSLEAAVGPTLTLTRATEASVTDYNNIIKQVASGEERYTGGRRVENVVTESETLNTSPWNNAENITVVEDADSVVHNGNTISLSELTDDATDAEHSTRQLNRLWGNLTALNLNATISLYVKAGTLDRIGVAFGNTHLGGDTFNASTGVWTKTTTYLNHTVEDVGGGVYRIGCSGKAGTTSAGSYSDDITIAMLDADTPANYSGSGDTIFVGGVQIEITNGQEDPSPSEYQATTAAAVSKWYATKRRTNLILESENPDGSTWIKTAATVTSGLSDLDGGTGAWSINEDGTAATSHFARQNHNVPVDGQYTISTYAKASNRDWLMMQAVSFAPDANVSAYFDLDNGVVGGLDSGADSHGIEDAGNGWYRCWMTLTLAGDLNGSWRIYPAEGDADVTFDGLSQESIIVYGPQVERGDTATAYIPTTDTVASSSFDTALTPTGLLIEEARTNICLQSEDLSTTWIAGADTLAVVGDEAIAPDGTLTADKIIDDSGAATSTSADVYVVQTFTVATATVYTFSAYCKADQLDWVAFRHVNFTTPGTVYSSFDLGSGVVGTAGAGVTTSIEDAGNGWYRCIATFTTDAADTVGQIRIVVADADGTPSVDDDGTSSIFVWGAQLEAGAFPTSYIPTAAATVTRNADDILSSDASWFNNAAGSFYTKSSFVGGAGDNKWIFQVDDGAATDRYYIYYDTGLDLNIEVTSSAGNNGALFTSMTVAKDTDYAHVAGYEADDITVYIDGSAKGTPDTTFDPPTDTMTNFGVGSYPIGNSLHLNGHIKEIRYYNTRLTNQELEDMSNGTFPVFTVQELEVGDDDWFRRRRILRRKRIREGRRYLRR